MKDLHQFLITPSQAAQQHGPNDRIVMSSRVRLARNLREASFPGWAKKAGARENFGDCFAGGQRLAGNGGFVCGGDG